MELAVARFNGRTAAEKAFGAMHARAGDAPWTRDVALLDHHHNGHMTLLGTVAGHYVSADETDHLSQKGAAFGGIIGAVLGVPLGPPAMAAGFVAGGVAGAEFAKPDETEAEPEALMNDLRSTVPKNSSAIVMIAPTDHVDAMLAALGDPEADVVRRTLSDGQMAEIEEALHDTPFAAPAPTVEGGAASGE